MDKRISLALLCIAMSATAQAKTYTAYLNDDAPSSKKNIIVGQNATGESQPMYIDQGGSLQMATPESQAPKQNNNAPSQQYQQNPSMNAPQSMDPQSNAAQPGMYPQQQEMNPQPGMVGPSQGQSMMPPQSGNPQQGMVGPSQGQNMMPPPGGNSQQGMVGSSQGQGQNMPRPPQNPPQGMMPPPPQNPQQGMMDPPQGMQPPQQQGGVAPPQTNQQYPGNDGYGAPPGPTSYNNDQNHYNYNIDPPDGPMDSFEA